MITRKELREASRETGLTLYQQEKDYLLKLFLFFYYENFEGAVFKGGTCLRYLFGLNRFSEDLDFNLKTDTTSREFKRQVKKTLKKLEKVGIEYESKRKELFEDAFTCEIRFKGPLYTREKYSKNKIQIDAGERSGIVLEPKWELIGSRYPETSKNFLVLAMDEKELLAEKAISLTERGKGRDLYDVWFLLKKGGGVDKDLIKKKQEVGEITFPGEEEYKRDLKRLTNRIIPYSQVVEEIRSSDLF